MSASGVIPKVAIRFERTPERKWLVGIHVRYRSRPSHGSSPQ